MRVVLSLLTLLSLPLPLAAQAGPVPGTELVQPVFEKADLVCSCRVDSVSILGGEAKSGDTSQRHMVRLTVSPLDVYKSGTEPSDPIVLEYPKEPMSGELGIQVDDIALLFLSRLTSGVYELTDRFIGLTIFSRFQQVQGNPGLAKLQFALAASVQRGSRNDRINAMRLLEGFSRIDPNTLTAVSALSSSSDAEIALTALGVWLKTGTPESVANFRRYVEAYRQDHPPIGLISAAGELGLITDVEALPDIERLSSSRFLSVRLGAMDAIRRIASPRSAPVLVRRLDDTERTIQYLAVITIAEIFRKFEGDYAPSMNLFNQRPQYYVGLWKQWWTDEGSKLYSSQGGAGGA